MRNRLYSLEALSPPMRQALRERAGARWIALGVLATAFPRRTAVLALACIGSGVTQPLFAVFVARVIGALPDAAQDGLDSPAGHALELALAAAAGVLVLGEVLGTIRGFLSDDLYRRFDETILARVMRAVLAPTGIGHLEDPERQQRVALALRAARFGPGELVSGLSTKWNAQARGLAATVLVATINPFAAAALFVVWQLMGMHLTTSRYRAFPFWIEPLKRAMYLLNLGLEPHAAKEVRLFGLADWLVGGYASAWAEVMDGLWQTRRSDLRLTTVGALMLASIYVVVLWWAATATATATGTLSLAALAVLVQGLLGMASLGSVEGDVWIDNGSIPIPSVLDLEREVAPHVEVGAAQPVRVREQIRFESVSFAYPHMARPILDGFDLEIRAGRSLAIVGANGTGKTTLLKLLLRLYEPTAGQMCIDGTPLREVDLVSWRRATAVIFQDFVRYELMARDNIGFGSVPLLGSVSNEAALERAARRADALDLIRALPAGFATTLSRRYAGGVDLSGGEWQRIALARALFAVEAGANVLMLDEPTAHLDLRAEIELFDRFLELTAGLTTIIVSHRFSTVRRADRIVVIADGRVVEQGSHEELVDRQGQYARMFNAQAAAFHA